MIVGADTSTTAVALARITEDGTLIDTTLIEPRGKLALDRVIDFATSCPTGSWWDGCTLLVIEQQVPGRGRTTGFWEQCLVAGMVVRQAARAGADVLPLTPSSWRKHLGWPKLGSAEAKRYALGEFRGACGPKMPPVSEHEAEAYWIAQAGLRRLS